MEYLYFSLEMAWEKLLECGKDFMYNLMQKKERGTQTSSLLIYLVYSFVLAIKKRNMKTDKGTDTAKKQIEIYPTSERKCVIDGKRFVVTRHFLGDKPLSVIMTEIAISRANREMGL